MRDNEKKIAATRQQQKNSVTAGLLVTAQEQADQETALVQSAREYLNDKHGLDQFPLLLDMYWKMQAGMEVNPEIEANRWFGWANQALGGFGSHIPRPLRKRVAFELCQATYEDLQKPETVEEIDLVIAAAKKEKKAKASPPPWSYEKGQVIMSLVGNEPFTPEMIDAINQVKFKIKNKDTGESADVLAKVKSYQISGVLRPQQEEMGLKREVVLTVQIANGYEEKFFNAIKKKCTGFKVTKLEAFRSPCTQGKILVQAAAEAPDDMVNSYFETALWSSIDEQPDGNGGPPMDEKYDFDDISEETWKNGEKDCAAFLEKAGPLVDGLDLTQVGHDFWLTRNHHGAGFWDGDYEDNVGQKLTEVAHKFSEVNLYVGDDGKVYSDGDGQPAKAAKATMIENLAPQQEVDASLYPALAKILVTAMTDDEILADIQQQFPGQEEEIKDSLKIGKGPWGDESGEFKQDGEEWCYITSEDAARKIAIEHVEQMLEDESELFTPSWLQNHLTISDTDRRLLSQEEADAYTEDMDDERAVEEAEMQDEFEAADDKQKEKVVEKAKEKVNEEMADRIEEELKNPVKYFIEDHGMYDMEQLMKANFISIDVKEAAEDAVDTDGWIHFLSSYSNDYTETAGGMVVFRTN